MAKYRYEIPSGDGNEKRSMKVNDRNANVIKGCTIVAAELERDNETDTEFFALIIQPDKERRILLPMDRAGATILTAKLIVLLGTDFIVDMEER